MEGTVRTARILIACFLFVILSFHESEATTFSYTFYGVTNCILDYSNEIGLYSPDPYDESIQLPFFGRFFIDEEGYFIEYDSGLDPYYIEYNLRNFVIYIGGYEFIAGPGWAFFLDGHNSLYTMGVSSSLANILDEHWFELQMFLDVDSPFDVTNSSGGSLHVMGLTTHERGEVDFFGEISNWYIQPVTPVPEPSTVFLLGIGIIGLALCARKRG
jgi:hypothetical protein